MLANVSTLAAGLMNRLKRGKKREGRVASDGDHTALVHLFTAMTSSTASLLSLEDERLPSPVRARHRDSVQCELW